MKKNMMLGCFVVLLYVSNFHAASSSSDAPGRHQRFKEPLRLMVFNRSLDKVTMFTHNTEPLAGVPGQEVSRVVLGSQASVAIDFDVPFFAIQNAHKNYYGIVQLNKDIVKQIKQKQLTTLALHIGAARMHMAYYKGSDTQGFGDGVRFVDLDDCPATDEMIEDALLKKLGIERKEKHSPVFCCRYLRASV